MAYRRHAELGTFLNPINPSKCSKQADCPHYVCNQPVRFAPSFVNIQKRMYPDRYDKFMTMLICHFGRNHYFKRRRGEIEKGTRCLSERCFTACRQSGSSGQLWIQDGAASPAPLVETVFSGHPQQVAPLAEKRYTFVACNVEKAVFVRIFRKNQRRDTLCIARVCVGSALQCNERNVSHAVAVG